MKIKQRKNSGNNKISVTVYFSKEEMDMIEWIKTSHEASDTFLPVGIPTVTKSWVCKTALRYYYSKLFAQHSN